MPIPGERRIESRNARKELKELVRPRVKADEFTSLFEAKSKNLLSITTHDWMRVRQRTIGKLNRSMKVPPAFVPDSEPRKAGQRPMAPPSTTQRRGALRHLLVRAERYSARPGP